MSLKGILEVEIEIKSPADKYYEYWNAKAHHIPNLCNHHIRKIDMHEGDWETEGSVKTWTYVVGGKVEVFKEKISFDKANKTMTLVGVGGDPLKDLKVYNGILKVTPRGQQGLAKWTLEYETRHDNVSPPYHYLDLVIKLSKDLDAALLKV